MQNAVFRKVRIYFTKVGDARFLSHLDLMRTMERAIRRAGLPVRYTEGMNPKVKMSFPTALPLGMESDCEVMEIQVPDDCTLGEVCARLADELPEGVVPFDGDALFSGEKWRVDQIEYLVSSAAGELPSRAEIEDLLKKDRVPVERRGKKVDLRPLLRRLDRSDGSVRVAIAWTETGTARPEDVLRALGRNPEHFTVRKVGLVFESSLGEMIRKTNEAQNPHQ